MAGKGAGMMHDTGLPLWGQYLLQGILIFIALSASAVVLSRAGRSPYLALLLIAPYVNIIALWAFAYTAWPKEKK